MRRIPAPEGFRSSSLLWWMVITGGAVGVLAVVIVLIIVAVKWAPQWLASTRGLNATDRAEELGRVRTALLATVAGLIAVVGAYYTARTFSLNRQGQITDRFTRAVDQLGSSTLDVRLGGIYALERIVRESNRDRASIIDILAAYVREHAPAHPNQGASSPADQDVSGGQSDAPAEGSRLESDVLARLTTDVQAVLTVLGRQTLPMKTGISLDLTGTTLANARLEGAHLERGHFSDSFLRRASLNRANLRDADLSRANLEDADMVETHLEGAILTDASLSGTRLHRARLDAAELSRANMEAAGLRNATLRRANLRHTHLKGANLWEADLQEADASEANLVDAQLGGANVCGADLSGANLKGANLRGARNLGAAKLSRALHDWSTLWPDGYEPPPDEDLPV